uniref:CBF1-interacting co-repressor CIR N-terminal domain-containing protein n=1 Tax=Oryza brachyantha TaxID=4533 RepID=J3N3Y1_ORYBR
MRGAAREREPPANPNPNPKKRKKEEVRMIGPDEEKYRLGYGLAGKGVAAPWYMSKPLPSSSNERKDRDGGEASAVKKNGGKKSIEELREERRKREAKEKERERALLGIPSRREKHSERGRSSR